MNIIKIPALQTNYIWMIYNNINECIIIDPGESITILKILKKFQLILKAILITHYHTDHINGIYTLTKLFPKTIVYGPIETQNKIISISVSEGDNLTLLHKNIKVFNFPGHTKNHIGFYCDPWLFCGDTIFSAGCGLIQTGYTQQMYQSFSKIRKFPQNTLIYSGHEYTLENINFAFSILPKDTHIINYRNKIIKLRQKNQSTVPTTLKQELKINIFFRCNNMDVKKALCFFPKFGEEWKIFGELRKRKSVFSKNNVKNINYYIP